MSIPVGVLALTWDLQRVSGCVQAMFFGRGAMEIVIVVVVVVLCVAVSWGFSLRRRMDKHAQEESDPELRQAYIDAQRQTDRGRASSRGFFS